MAIALQLVGAIAILIPFAYSQVRPLATTSPAYLWPNLIGSILLAILAAADSQWGFLLLEGAWTGFTALGLWRRHTGAST
jgi:hypothetical protein